MISTWLYKIDEKEYGPFGLKTIEKLLEEGTLTNDHMVKGKASEGNWIKISEMLEISGAQPQKTAQPEQAKENGKGEQLKCKKCKENFSSDSVQKIHIEGIASYLCPKCNSRLISGEKKSKKKVKIEWRFYISERLGIMFGPFPIGAITFLVICYLIYHYFGAKIIAYYKTLF